MPCRFSEAYDAYTRLLASAVDERAPLLANASLCSLKVHTCVLLTFGALSEAVALVAQLHRLSSAVEHADECICADPSWWKAYARKSYALCARADSYGGLKDMLEASRLLSDAAALLQSNALQRDTLQELQVQSRCPARCRSIRSQAQHATPIEWQPPRLLRQRIRLGTWRATCWQGSRGTQHTARHVA